MTRDGRTLYCNALVEDPDRLILAVYNPVRKFYSLPGCEVRPTENPADACARTLMNECGVGAKKLLDLYEDDAGQSAYVVVMQAVIDGFPRTTRVDAPVAAMTAEQYLAQTPWPKFYGALFAIVQARKLYCVHIERFSLRTRRWDLEDHYVHALTSEEATRNFLVGETLAVNEGRLRVVASGLAIGLKVADTKGKVLLA
jgi:ADP-ribose pyrophosphatase YjhB (NUDIX family)